jgi:TM2 domain-containing membrane protein YozV
MNRPAIDVTYQIVLNGIQAGKSASDVRAKFAALFKATPAQVDAMLLANGYILKKGASLDSANRYKSAIEAAGGVCDLINENEPLSFDIDLPTSAPQATLTAPVGAPGIPPSTDKSTVSCIGCGKTISIAAQTCPECGAPQKVAGKRSKSKVVATMLAIFLGDFGAHRFYLGKWIGVLYLLFFWTLVPGIIAFIEAIGFIATNDRKWDAKYNKGVSSGGTSGVATVLSIVACVIVCFARIGFMAAVAIPAYSDYTVAGKLAHVYIATPEITVPFDDYIEKNRAIPSSVQELGVTFSDANVRSIDIDPSTGIISLALGFRQLDGKHFLLIPKVDANRNITWTCGSDDIKAAFLPRACRQN